MRSNAAPYTESRLTRSVANERVGFPVVEHVIRYGNHKALNLELISATAEGGGADSTNLLSVLTFHCFYWQEPDFLFQQRTFYKYTNLRERVMYMCLR
jgi:hypothetical protein